MTIETMTEGTARSRRLPRILLGIFGAFVVLIGGFFVVALVVGGRQPTDHEASASQTIDAPPAEVFAAITSPAAYPDWRDTVHAVEVLDDTPSALQWHEDWGRGPGVTLTVVERVDDERLVIEIADDNETFAGSWTFALAEDGDGTAVTITERGTIDSAIARFFMHVLMPSAQAHYLELYLDQLDAHVGAP